MEETKLKDVTDNIEESDAEKREKLEKSFGVVLCTRNKKGENTPLLSKIELAQEMQLPSVQFDFRYRSIEEIQKAIPELEKYRQAYPETIFSLHGDTPMVDEKTFDFINRDKIFGEIELLGDLKGESYTVHPFAVSKKVFEAASSPDRERVINNYCDIFVEAIKSAINKSNKFSIAIESRPNKGANGSWGQTVQEMMLLIKKIEEDTVENTGLNREKVCGYVGVTIDINHVLEGVEPADYETVLREWFKELGDYIKVVHLYTPSETDGDFRKKYELVMDLAVKFSPKARIFMESKQDPEITKRVYSDIKK